MSERTACGRVGIIVSLSDKKFFNTTENRWSAEQHSYTDYYPFGLAISDRSYNSGGYRYGFNSKENDADFGLTANIQDYGFRLYNPAMGRFLSVDPLSGSYPMLTPYQFASNRPIDGIDLDGKEWEEIKHDLFSAAEGIKKFGIQTAEGIYYLANNPSKIVPTLVDGVKQQASDVATMASTGGKIVSNQFFETDYDIDEQAFNQSAQRVGQGIVVSAGTSLAGTGLSHTSTATKAAFKDLQNVKVQVSVDPSYLNAGLNPNSVSVSFFRKIKQAKWGAIIEDYGTTAAKHIEDGHFHNSRTYVDPETGKKVYKPSSRFSEANSSIGKVKELVAEAMAKGSHSTTKGGQYLVHYTFNDVIGTTRHGAKTKKIEVQLDKDGNVKNSYPVPEN